MHSGILTPEQDEVLAALKGAPFPQDTYLAGGTAVALHLGHRRSIDFDFFTPTFDHPAPLTQFLEDTLPGFQLVESTAGTLLGIVGETSMSIFRYKYPCLEPLVPTPWRWPLAAPLDLALMKLAAISDRGARRDFVDLFLLCRDFELRRLVERFEEKFGTARSHPYHLLRALTWFEDAELDPMPEMLTDCRWDDVKSFFQSEVPAIFTEVDPDPD